MPKTTSGELERQTAARLYVTQHYRSSYIGADCELEMRRVMRQIRPVLCESDGGSLRRAFCDLSLDWLYSKGMADEAGKKRFWQFGFAQSVVASLVAAAIWTLGSALTSFVWARLSHAGVIVGTTINVSLLLIGVYVMGLAAYLTIRWLPRRKRPKSEGIAFRILLEDADLLLRLYRRLGEHAVAAQPFELAELQPADALNVRPDFAVLP